MFSKEKLLQIVVTREKRISFPSYHTNIYNKVRKLPMSNTLYMGDFGKRSLRPVYKFLYHRQKGFVGSGMSSRSAQILSRSFKKEFEKSSVRGTE